MTTNYFNSSNNNDRIDSLLIIEKDGIQRKGLMVALIDMFSEIRLTNNPHEAVELVKRRQFEVIISESDFDVISGNELIRILHKHSPDALIIIISSHLNEETKAELKNQGATLIFDKPIDIPTLINEINNYKTSKEKK
jgi:DNA-binding NtrC family response regulator